MEFNEKLQKLRKYRGLTQEELAEKLYVSRTAISKWESGRGYPNIDSLKSISDCFAVSLDELLSGEDISIITDEDSKNKTSKMGNLTFGLLDSNFILLFFLPVFAQREYEIVREVSLLTMNLIMSYTKKALIIAIAVTGLYGIALLVLQNYSVERWKNVKYKLSAILSIIDILLFMVSQQLYPAVISFVFLTIKVFLLIKWGVIRLVSFE